MSKKLRFRDIKKGIWNAKLSPENKLLICNEVRKVFEKYGVEKLVYQNKSNKDYSGARVMSYKGK